jgi:hypothetical protein
VEAIAENPYRFEVRPEIPAVYDTKGRMVAAAQRRVFIQFGRGSAPDYAQKIGLASSFEFATKPTYEGGNEFPSELWLCYYDSEAAQQIHGWTDEERQLIEGHLPSCPGVLIVERPKLKAPWPAYAKTRKLQGRRTADVAAEEIAATVTSTGTDPGDVIAYERQEAKPGWEAIVARMETLLVEETTEDEPEPLVAA